MKARTSRRLRIVAAIAVAAAVAFAPLSGTQRPPRSASLAVRLFGPIGKLAASVQWVRADLAFRAGRLELYLSRARTALALAPDSAGGWNKLAWDQGFVLASPEREPDPLRRMAWIRAGLATAREGESSATGPGAMAFVAGQILVKVPLIDAELPWPGGMAAVWDAAAEQFERAQAQGFDPAWATTMATGARREAALARSRPR